MKALLALIMCGAPFSIASMDTSVRSLAHEIELQRQNEVKRLSRYNLDQSDFFLKQLRTQLKKETHPRKYLEKLHIFASGLLCQHIVMELISKLSYLRTLFQKSKTEYDIILHRLKAKHVGDDIIISPETEEQLNIILTHKDLIQIPHELSAPEIATIFSWILDSEKGVWLNNLGRKIKVLYESVLIENLLIPIQKKTSDIILAITHTPIFEAEEKIIEENLISLFSASKNIIIFFTLTQSQTSDRKKEEITNDYKRNDLYISNLYRIVQSEYQKMYALVRAELYQTFKDLLVAGQKDIKIYLLPIPEKERLNGNIPASFPAELQTIANPETIIATPSLNEQLEQAKKIWEKEHRAPIKQKKKWRKPKSHFSLNLPLEQKIEAVTAPAETEPKKMRVGSDKSFIAEGGEDDLQIIIEDPAHESAAIIFKTRNSPAALAQLKSLPKINYTPWVNEWFENPEKAILTHGYKDLKNPRYRAGQPDWMPIILHAFPKLVDEYIYSYGSVSQTPSRMHKGKNDIMVTIPGKMEYPNGIQETGIFTYIIDSANGQWYHRMFTPASYQKMATDFMEKGYFAPEVKGYYDVYFPPLAKP